MRYLINSKNTCGVRGSCDWKSNCRILGGGGCGNRAFSPIYYLN